MTETLTIHRDWTTDYTDTKYFTLEYLLGLMHSMGMPPEEFTEFITGLTDDDYSDLGCDIMRDTQADNQGLTYEQVVDQCMADESFRTCYTVYRLWNTQHTEQEAMKYWKESCVATLEGMLEE